MCHQADFLVPACPATCAAASKAKDWDRGQDDSDGGAPEKIDVDSEDDDDNGW